MRRSILTAIRAAPTAALLTATPLASTGCAGPDAGFDPLPEPTNAANDTGADRSPIVAYVHGQPLRRDTLWPALVEAAGPIVLDEFVLDAAIQRRLQRENVTLTAPDIAAELDLLAAALDNNPDTAARLLAELRQRRGLGDDRFDRLLRRNAGLRALVAEDADLPADQLDAQARRLFVQRHGPTFRVRLLTADTPGDARKLRQRVLNGEAFADVAAEHSTDASAAQGGLLSPINPADPTYPQAVRAVLSRLDPDVDAGLSDVLALDGGYAVLQLLEALPADDVAYESVAEELRLRARRNNERLLMEQLAGALRDEADLLVTDRAMGRAQDD